MENYSAYKGSAAQYYQDTSVGSHLTDGQATTDKISAYFDSDFRERHALDDKLVVFEI